MLEPYYLIDASIYIFRSYFGLPENWYSQKSGLGLSQEGDVGQESYPTQAVYGYLDFLLTLLEAESPNYIAAAFDESLGTCFRNTVYPEYKANRVLPDPALAFQLNACVEVTRLLGVTDFASKTHEADDIVGTLAKIGRESGHQIIVISGDKDLSQLIVSDDVAWDFGRGEPQDRCMVKAKLGIWPEQIADYLALVGDSIDNIPGVPGVGPKTAAALLGHFSDIETLLNAGERVAELPIRGAKQLPAKIESYREQILMSQKLTVIAEDVPMLSVKNLEIIKNGSIESNSALMRRSIDMDKLALFCEAMGLPDRFLIRADKISVPPQKVYQQGRTE